MLREEVTEVDIADIVSKWSGIPVKPHPSRMHLSLDCLTAPTPCIHAPSYMCTHHRCLSDARCKHQGRFGTQYFAFFKLVTTSTYKHSSNSTNLHI